VDTVGSEFEQAWRRRFERYATVRDDDAGIAGWSTTGLAARVRHFERHWAGAATGSTWADVGCGAGTYTRVLADKELNVIGADYSAQTLSKAALRGGAFAWVLADVTQLPFAPESLDGVLCFGVTQALSSSERALLELARVVRPGGQVWIDGLNRWCAPHLLAALWRRLRRRGYHLRYESPWQMRDLARQAGVTDVRILWLPILPARFQRWQWLAESKALVAIFAAIPLLGALLSHSFVVAGVIRGPAPR
jgi:SAM-dependent methyltransferase